MSTFPVRPHSMVGGMAAAPQLGPRQVRRVRGARPRRRLGTCSPFYQSKDGGLAPVEPRSCRWPMRPCPTGSSSTRSIRGRYIGTFPPRPGATNSTIGVPLPSNEGEGLCAQAPEGGQPLVFRFVEEISVTRGGRCDGRKVDAVPLGAVQNLSQRWRTRRLRRWRPRQLATPPGSCPTFHPCSVCGALPISPVQSETGRVQVLAYGAPPRCGDQPKWRSCNHISSSNV